MNHRLDRCGGHDNRFIKTEVTLNMASNMKQIKLGIGILLAASMLTSCGTISGTLVGAGIGAIAGDAKAGALIGAGLGFGADTSR